MGLIQLLDKIRVWVERAYPETLSPDWALFPSRRSPGKTVAVNTHMSRFFLETTGARYDGIINYIYTYTSSFVI